MENVVTGRKVSRALRNNQIPWPDISTYASVKHCFWLLVVNTV